MKVTLDGVEVELNPSEEERSKLKYTVSDMIKYCVQARNFLELHLKVAVVGNNIKQEPDGKLTITLLLDPTISLI